MTTPTVFADASRLPVHPGSIAIIARASMARIYFLIVLFINVSFYFIPPPFHVRGQINIIPNRACDSNYNTWLPMLIRFRSASQSFLYLHGNQDPAFPELFLCERHIISSVPVILYAFPQLFLCERHIISSVPAILYAFPQLFLCERHIISSVPDILYAFPELFLCRSRLTYGQADK